MGGFNAIVCGQEVHVKVWIHFFIGDTEGNNKSLGHMPGNKDGVSCPYRDCQCDFANLCNVNPKCEYTTLSEMQKTMQLIKTNEVLGKATLKAMSRYNITNALTHPDLPLSDNVHGAYRMMPPELLHTSGAGLILYMFESLQKQIGGGIDRDAIDKLHVRMSASIRRQSDQDFPRGAMRNGLIDGTKCQSTERRGNCFDYFALQGQLLARIFSSGHWE